MKKNAFRQVIHPGPRGTVRYLINTIYGVKPVCGPRLSEHFAARRCEDVDQRIWVMTHLPTGLYVPWSARRILYRSQQVAAVLEQAVDWSKAKRPGLTKTLSQRLVAEIQKIPDTPRRAREKASVV